MELEEMKSLWQNLSIKVENQDRIQKDILMEMTKTRFRRKMDGIRIPELVGTVVCLGYAIYLGYNFNKIELLFNQMSAIFTILFFVLLPIASLWTVYRLKSLEISHLETVEMLRNFNQAKRDFWKVQQFGVWLSGLVFFTLVPTLADIQGNLDQIRKPGFWMIFVPFGLAFIFFFTRYVMKKYRKVIQQSEDILLDV